MTSASRSRLWFNTHTVCAGSNRGSLCFKKEDFRWHMQEPDFHDHLRLDKQAQGIFAIAGDGRSKGKIDEMRPPSLATFASSVLKNHKEESIAPNEDEPIFRCVVRPKAYFRGSPRSVTFSPEWSRFSPNAATLVVVKETRDS